jgi:hypothetical protein
MFFLLQRFASPFFSPFFGRTRDNTSAMSAGSTLNLASSPAAGAVNLNYSPPASFSVFEPDLLPPFFDVLDSANSGAFNVAGIDFSSPSNTSKAFTIEAWVNG